MDGNPGFLENVKKTNQKGKSDKILYTDIIVLSQEIEGNKDHIAAFTCENDLEEYLSRNPDYDFSNTQSEKMNLAYKADQALDYVYLAYLRKDGEEIFVGYHINRFEAQHQVYKKGFIRSIPLILCGEVSASVEKSKTKFQKKVSSSKLLEHSSRVEQANASFSSQFHLIGSGNHWKLLSCLITILVVVLGYLFVDSLRNDVDFAENKPQVSWLPAYCENISYYQSPTILAYEFRISEQGFLQFAKEQNLQYSMIKKDIPISVSTYRLYGDAAWKKKQNLQDASYQNKWKEITRPVINRGYEIKGDNDIPGANIAGAYDAENRILYYWSQNSR